MRREARLPLALFAMVMLLLGLLPRSPRAECPAGFVSSPDSTFCTAVGGEGRPDSGSVEMMVAGDLRFAFPNLARTFPISMQFSHNADAAPGAFLTISARARAMVAPASNHADCRILRRGLHTSRWVATIGSGSAPSIPRTRLSVMNGGAPVTVPGAGAASVVVELPELPSSVRVSSVTAGRVSYTLGFHAPVSIRLVSGGSPTTVSGDAVTISTRLAAPGGISALDIHGHGVGTLVYQVAQVVSGARN